MEVVRLEFLEIGGNMSVNGCDPQLRLARLLPGAISTAARCHLHAGGEDGDAGLKSHGGKDSIIHEFSLIKHTASEGPAPRCRRATCVCVCVRVRVRVRVRVFDEG
ncbi:hypothetical protein QQF64_035216 [Cirrhinus molitorella]|uniref:Uncharacterized protein n=1 Tax=Cirrhinus molitorella TaxID=172907 RepID=A0ABR3NF62_9TELE